LRLKSLDKVILTAKKLGLDLVFYEDSVLKGRKGNTEIFCYFKRS
jgi:hypothetical protein